LRAGELSTVAGTAFVVSDALGNITPGESHGVFAADTRYVSQLELQIETAEVILLRSGTLARGCSEVYATNSGKRRLSPHSLEIYRRRELTDSLTETIELTNRGDETLKVPFRVAFDADFADIFEVRSGSDHRRRRGTAKWVDGNLVFLDRRPGSERRATLQFDPPPDSISSRSINYVVTVHPGEAYRITITVEWFVPHPETTNPVPISLRDDQGSVVAWLEQVPVLESSDSELSVAYTQAVQDIATLELALDTGHHIPAAGLPWYLAIFGRDSIITSIQCLLLGRRQALGTLRTLAAYQSNEMNDFRDAEPGKIAHEIRFGELSVSETIPHARYYGTVDATPLWIILLDLTLAWDSAPSLIEELLPHAEAAMSWIDNFGDLDGDGFVEYQRRSSHGLLNQGWKDSWDSVRFAGRELAEGPIALVEVQGYVYAAKQSMANIYERIGQDRRAGDLRAQASQLKERIHDAFWMPDEEYYAMALDGQKRQVTSITSNPGHLLWSGAIDPPYAERIARRLLAPDMFSGWGIRTMSEEMGAYNPFSYHNGSIWPHDNSLIVAGLSRYGFEESAMTVINAMIDASTFFEHSRLPELFCGFARDRTPFPIDYPVACSPQAWASGSIILMLQTMAGISTADSRLQVNPLNHKRELVLRGVWFDNAVKVIDCDPCHSVAAETQILENEDDTVHIEHQQPSRD
jgi:glycogen debranching enzyme